MMGNVKMLFTSEQINELTSMITTVIVEWDRYAGSIFLFKTFLGMDRCQSVNGKGYKCFEEQSFKEC